MPSPPPPRRRIAAAIALAAALLAPASALADPTAAEKDRARKLMDEGAEKLEQHDLNAALQDFRAADAIMGVPSTGVEVARTELALGHLIEALEAAVKVTKLPKKPNEPGEFILARRAAADLASKIGPRIPTLRITIEGPPAGAPLEITLDGAPIPASSIADARLVNPGQHVVQASSPGFTTTSGKITVEEQQSAALVVNLAKAAPVVVAPPPKPVVEEPAPSGRSPLVYVGFGVGGAGLIAGTIAGALSLAAASSAKKLCDAAGHCQPQAAGDIDRSKTLANVSNVTLGVGVVGVALGVVGLVISRKPAPKPPAGAALFIAPSPGGGAVGVAGKF